MSRVLSTEVACNSLQNNRMRIFIRFYAKEKDSTVTSSIFIGGQCCPVLDFACTIRIMITLFRMFN